MKTRIVSEDEDGFRKVFETGKAEDFADSLIDCVMHLEELAEAKGSGKAFRKKLNYYLQEGAKYGVGFRDIQKATG